MGRWTGWWRKAFEAGLAARGLLGPQLLNPRYRLAITIHQFDANQYIRREATADFSIALIESATGQEVWRDRHRAYTVDGSILALNVGIFAAPEDLRRVALRTMNETVDVLLDSPGFRARAGRNRQSPGPWQPSVAAWPGCGGGNACPPRRIGLASPKQPRGPPDAAGIARTAGPGAGRPTLAGPGRSGRRPPPGGDARLQRGHLQPLHPARARHDDRYYQIPSGITGPR